MAISDDDQSRIKLAAEVMALRVTLIQFAHALMAAESLEAAQRSFRHEAERMLASFLALPLGEHPVGAHVTGETEDAIKDLLAEMLPPPRG